jgi:steroid 5-alpha reductase family enzyme
MKQKFFIDSHKAVTGLFVLALIAFYSQWDNPTAWIYLALHGTYGILWNLKSRYFPDKSWEQPADWRFALVAWGGLTVYWVAPWILTSQGVAAPGWYMGLCVALCLVGVFLHFASDMQKYVALTLRPGELITGGLWSLSRNPNYFGELLIYLGFALLAMHWLPLVLLALFVIVYWVPNMRRKDRSLARYPGFAEYKAHTRLFIPLLI